MADLVLNKQMLQLATEGINLDLHWPGYASGVTIGPGFDIGASAVKPDSLEALLTKFGVDKNVIAKLRKTTQQEGGGKEKVTGVPAAELMFTLGLNAKAKPKDGITTGTHISGIQVLSSAQKAMDLGYIIMNRPDSGYLSTAEQAFALSHNNLHPALKEVVLKISYGSPATAKKYGGEIDQQLSRESDPLKQTDIMIGFFEKLLKDKLNDVRKRSAKGMLYFLKEIRKTFASGGKVIIENKPLSEAQISDPNDPNVQLMTKMKLTMYKNGDYQWGYPLEDMLSGKLDDMANKVIARKANDYKSMCK